MQTGKRKRIYNLLYLVQFRRELKGLLTLICLPGSSSTNCLAISLQDFLDTCGTLLSSSQYLLDECEYKAAGVACVNLVLVTIPVDFPTKVVKMQSTKTFVLV